MRTTAILLLSVQSLCAAAQPDDLRFTNPCGFAPNDSIDATGDGIPDLVVQGISTGTDDVPSSSGYCRLLVTNLPGTEIYCWRGGAIRAIAFTRGDSIAPHDARYGVPRLAQSGEYADCSVVIAGWGFGNQAKCSFDPDAEKRRFLFLTTGNDKTWHGSFSISPPDSLDRGGITVGSVVPADQLLIVR